jgi:hypothetical protein
MHNVKSLVKKKSSIKWKKKNHKMIKSNWNLLVPPSPAMALMSWERLPQMSVC